MDKENRTNFILKTVLIALIITILVLGSALVFKIVIPLVRSYRSFELQEEDTVTHTGSVDLLTEKDDEPESVKSLTELRDAKDLSTALREWSDNTEQAVLMKSKHVINFLLLGGDEKQKLADSIMLVSLNRDTKKVFLTSIMRDSYTYIPIKNSDTYGKINAAYSYGGAQLVKSTVERDFKIDVDYYVSVNYEMFKNIVDTLGGVQVTVQEHEARAVEKECGVDCPYGEKVTLNGQQALGFCRVRHCDVDADVSRTRRQRQFISALIEKAKDVTIDQIDDILDEFAKYIRTDCSKKELASLASQAILNRWSDYEVISNSFPQEDERLDYNGYAWVWIVDYPLSAYHLHNMIYGESNIILNEDRVSAIDIMQSTGNTGTAAP